MDIIQDGKNGFLPGTEEEWFTVLSALVENKELRERIGKAGAAKQSKRNIP